MSEVAAWFHRETGPQKKQFCITNMYVITYDSQNFKYCHTNPQDAKYTGAKYLNTRWSLRASLWKNYFITPVKYLFYNLNFWRIKCKIINGSLGKQQKKTHMQYTSLLELIAFTKTRLFGAFLEWISQVLLKQAF